MKNILILLLLLAAVGCNDYSVTIHSGAGLEGTWNTEFTATYISQSGIPENDISTYQLIHISTMNLNDGHFDITLDPAIPPLLGTGQPRSHWEGDYHIEDGFLIMSESNITDLEDVYNFKISGDSLQLILNYINHPGNDSLTVVPIFGGLPWGRAQLWHSGYFIRDVLEN